MYTWQKDMWAACTGSDPKEMKIIMNGRQIGKSYMAQMWTEVFAYEDFYQKIDQAIVDNEQWFTVKCSPGISKWVKSQPKNMWYEHIDKNWQVYKNAFDIHEKIYTMLQLKYSNVRI